MMEYTLARIVTIVCGVALIASILPPVQSMFDESESSEIQEQSQNICRMIDTFYAHVQFHVRHMHLCLSV